MKRSLAALTLVFLVSLVAPAKAAASATDLSAFGIELCPQSICGAAIFTGLVSGKVANAPAPLGTFTVAVTHDDLPAPFQTAAVTGGVFQIKGGGHTLRGGIVGGTLFNNNDNTFAVTMVLVPTSSGVLIFQGLLNHNTFPPTISGRLISYP